MFIERLNYCDEESFECDDKVMDCNEFDFGIILEVFEINIFCLILLILNLIDKIFVEEMCLVIVLDLE